VRYLPGLASALFAQGKAGEAADLFEELLTMCERIGDRQIYAETLHSLGVMALVGGKTQEAIRYMHQSLPLLQELSLAYPTVLVQCDLAVARLLRGEASEAVRLLANGVTGSYKHFGLGSLAQSLLGQALLAFRQGRHAEAARAFGTATALVERFTIGKHPLYLLLHSEVERAVTQAGLLELAEQANQVVRQHLPTVAFRSTYEAMEAINLAEVVAAGLVVERCEFTAAVGH
ncbi:MAG: tetratricopeptide repeat protein, partial [Chloroflexaceae bacterium]|nr:tetratricopeptide repeat protein [Chloroflexaceae bacterium]